MKGVSPFTIAVSLVLLVLFSTVSGEEIPIVSSGTTAPTTSKTVPKLRFGGCEYSQIKINPNGYFTLSAETRLHQTVPYLEDFPMPVISPRGSASRLRILKSLISEKVLFEMKNTNGTNSLPANFLPACVDYSALQLEDQATAWYVTYLTYRDTRMQHFESESRAYLIYDAKNTYVLFYYSHNLETTSILNNSYVYGYAYGYRNSTLPPVYLSGRNHTETSDFTDTFEQIIEGSNLKDGSPGCYLFQVKTDGACRPSRGQEPFPAPNATLIKARVLNYTRQMSGPLLSPFAVCKPSDVFSTQCQCRPGYFGDGNDCKRHDMWIQIDAIPLAPESKITSRSCLEFGEEVSSEVDLPALLPFGDRRYDQFVYFEDGFLTLGKFNIDDPSHNTRDFKVNPNPVIAPFAADVNATNSRICHVVGQGSINLTAYEHFGKAISRFRNGAAFNPRFFVLVSYEDLAPDRLIADDNVYRRPWRTGFESMSAQVLILADHKSSYMFFIYRFNNYTVSLPWTEANQYDMTAGFSSIINGQKVETIIQSLPGNMTELKRADPAVLNAYALDQYTGNLGYSTLSGFAYQVDGSPKSPPPSNRMCNVTHNLYARISVSSVLTNTNAIDCLRQVFDTDCQNLRFYDVSARCLSTSFAPINLTTMMANFQNYLTLHDNSISSEPIQNISAVIKVNFRMVCSSPNLAYFQRPRHAEKLIHHALDGSLLKCGAITEPGSFQIGGCFAPIYPTFVAPGPSNLTLPISLDSMYSNAFINQLRNEYKRRYPDKSFKFGDLAVIGAVGTNSYKLSLEVQNQPCTEDIATLNVPQLRVRQPILVSKVIPLPQTAADSARTTRKRSENPTTIENLLDTAVKNQEVVTTSQSVLVSVAKEGGSKTRGILIAFIIMLAAISAGLVFLVIRLYKRSKANARRKLDYDRVEFCKSTTSIVRAVEDDDSNIIGRNPRVRDDVAVFQIDS